MEKMLLISQNETDTWFVNGISIGKRDPRNIWGDKIKEVLKEKGEDEEEFVKQFGKSYEDHIRRVLINEEFPKKQVLDKILDHLGKELTYFHDKQLKNVIVNDSRLIVGEYETDARAEEVKKQLDEIIISNYQNGNPIILRLPKE
jgi:hypothetical protein